MAAFLSDTFTDSSGSTIDLTAHTPEVGGAWIQGAAKFGGNVADTIKIFSGENRARTSATTSYGTAYNNVLPPTADVDITVTLGRGTTASAAVPGVMARADPTANNAYVLRMTSTVATLTKVVGGGITTIGQTASSASNGVPDNGSVTIRMLVKGGQITIYRNGVLLLNVADASIPGNGYVGVVSTSQGYADTLSVIDAHDSFVSGDMSASGTTTVAGVGEAVKSATASAAGTSTGDALGVAFHVGFGNSTSGATADFVGLTLQFHEGAFSAAGISSSSFVGRAIITAVGESVAGSDAFAESTTLPAFMGVFRAAGSVFAQAEGSAVMTAGFNAAGSTTVSGRGGWIGVGSVAEASGSTTVLGSSALPTPADPVVVTATAVAAGSSTAVAYTVLPVVATFQIQDTGTTVRGVGMSIRAAVATAAGSTPVANAEGTGIRESVARFVRRSIAAFVALVTPIDTEVPPGRSIVLPGEDRTVTPAAEPRLVILAADPSRKLVLTAEGRAVTVSAGLSRTITLQAESRSITP